MSIPCTQLTTERRGLLHLVHDACTAEGWQSKLLGQIAEGTAKTQDLTISEQLKVGVRVFDLRPERVLENNSYVLRCAHGSWVTTRAPWESSTWTSPVWTRVPATLPRSSMRPSA